jgi:hypothetical protein
MTQLSPRLLVLLAAVAAAGCAPDRASLEVAAICGMPDTCKFNATCDTVYAGMIYYNSTGARPLNLPIQLDNQLLNNGNPGTSRVNTNDAHITGYRMEYGPGGPASITVDSGHEVIPAGGSSLVFINALYNGAPFGRYTASVVFIGYFDNGREFELEPWPMGVEVNPTYGVSCQKAGDVVVCGSTQQSDSVCGTP